MVIATGFWVTLFQPELRKGLGAEAVVFWILATVTARLYYLRQSAVAAVRAEADAQLKRRIDEVGVLLSTMPPVGRCTVSLDIGLENGENRCPCREEHTRGA